MGPSVSGKPSITGSLAPSVSTSPSSAPSALGSIGPNVVFDDIDRDGVQDPNEPNLPGVNVTLICLDEDGNSIVIETVTTNAQGQYEFLQVQPAQCYISVTPEVNDNDNYVLSPIDPDCTQGCNQIYPNGTSPVFDVNYNENVDHVDVGMHLPLADIGPNVVFNDLDDDGVQDPNEDPLEGVTVTLWCDGQVVGSYVTGSDGVYEFNGVHPGECHVSVSNEVDGNDNYVFSPIDPGCTEGCNQIQSDGTSPVVTVDYDDTIDDWNVGMHLPLANIGPNTVFNDLNEDGTHDENEPTLQDVPIALYCDGALVTETTSDVNGVYEFTDVHPGSCYIQVTAPGEDFTYSPVVPEGNQIGSDGTSPTVAIDYDETVDTWDVGMYMPPATVGPNVVFDDTDGDGERDPQEPPLQGVTVHLYCYLDGAPVLMEITVTDANGEYVFNNVQPGLCYVQVNPFVGDDTYVFSPINPVGNQISPDGTSPEVDIDWNDVIDDWIVGMYQPVTLGNYIWEDDNGNGMMDEGEAGVVTMVSLVDAGTEVDTVMSHDDGSYWFTDLSPGEYSVKFYLPPDFKIAPPPPPMFFEPGATIPEMTMDDIVIDSIVDNTALTASQQLMSGDINMSYDAGIYLPIEVEGVVFDDLNGNGIRDEGEPSLGGATITLLDSLGNVPGSLVSDLNDGTYSLTDLMPGTYYGLIQPPSPEYQLSPLMDDVAGGNNFDPETFMTGQITLASGQSGAGAFDAGFFRPVTITSHVWDDEDADGIQDAEEGRHTAPMTANLYDPNSATPEVPLQSVDTSQEDGSFQFTKVSPGDYEIGFYPGSEFVSFTLQDAGADDTKDSDVHPTTGRTSFSVVSGVDITDIHAGVTTLPSIGPNRVFQDDDADGMFDPEDGEVGLPFVTVTLYDTNNDIVKVTFTDANGDYSFEGLQPGDYYIAVNKESNFELSPVVNGGNQLSESWENEYGNSSPVVTLGPGNNIDNTLMAGMWEPVIIGNKVWNDLDGDGVQQSTEPGMEGVTATLKNGNGQFVASEETDVDGHYYFYGNPPGDYQVTFTLPDGFIFTVRAKCDATGGGPTHPDGATGYDDVTSDVDRDTGSTDVKTLKSGEENYSFDAGMFIPITLNGTAWHDLNADGLWDEDAEPPLRGMDVTLFDRDGDVVGSTPTNAAGVWIFDEMPPGTYSVMITPPADQPYKISPQPQVPRNSTLAGYTSDFDPETWRTTPMYFPGGTSSDGFMDVGMYLPATIGEYIWFDTSPNGIQDGDEEPFEKPVTIKLYNSYGIQVDETESTAAGFYQFYPVMPGSYQLEFILPDDDEEYQFTIPNAGNDTALDSDVSPTTGRTSVTVTSGEENLDVDAGVMDYGPYYPDWTNDIQVCTNDGFDPDWLELQRLNYLYKNKEECCLEHFWWRMTQCMANEEFKFISNGETCDTKIFFEDWEDNSPMAWTATTQFDTVQECCATEHWFSYEECVASSPVMFKFEFCVDIQGLVDPQDCQSADIYANVLEDAINEGCHHAHGLEGIHFDEEDHHDDGGARRLRKRSLHTEDGVDVTTTDAMVTKIGGVSLSKVDGSTVCGGDLGGQGFINDLTGTTPDIVSAADVVVSVCGVITVEEDECKDVACLTEHYQLIADELEHFVDDGDLSLAIQRRSSSRLPPVPELQVTSALEHTLSTSNLLLPETITGDLETKYYHGSDPDTCLEKPFFQPGEVPYEDLSECCANHYQWDINTCCSSGGGCPELGIAAIEEVVDESGQTLGFYPTWNPGSLCDSKPASAFETWENHYSTLDECCDAQFGYAADNRSCKSSSR